MQYGRKDLRGDASRGNRSGGEGRSLGVLRKDERTLDLGRCCRPGGLDARVGRGQFCALDPLAGEIKLEQITLDNKLACQLRIGSNRIDRK